MNLISSPGNSLNGEVILPGDKSLSHRAALFAALAEGESRIENFLIAGVTQAMLGALTALGVPWQLNGTTLTVQGRGLRGMTSPIAPIDCGNSATTLRLLAGALAAAGIPAVLGGSPGLRQRPMKRIVEPLSQMGVPIESTDGCAPLKLSPSGSKLKPLIYDLPVASAQVKSCLLLAALAADGPTTLSEPGPSRDHTERMLSSMGVSIASSRPEHSKFIVTLTPPSLLQLATLHMALPSDISSAAFLIVAALITPGSEITLRGVGLNPTRTGLLDALRTMKADIRLSNMGEQHGEPVGDLTVRHASLVGTQVSGPLVVRMIDEFPIFAVAAACARGDTVVSQAEELRHKESDRIAALCAELRSLGVEAVETPDGFIISGGVSIRGGQVSSHSDHRLAMAMTVAGLAAREPVTVRGAEMIAESFPEFVPYLQNLGASLELRSGTV